MGNNRTEILAQLAGGQISADQAAEQLRGAGAPANTPLTPQPAAALAQRWLRIRVTDLESGRQRVAVNLPLSWLSVGPRLGGKYSPAVAALDVNELLTVLQSGSIDQVVDVEDLDDGQRVQIFIE
jgi:hypothetical protein